MGIFICFPFGDIFYRLFLIPPKRYKWQKPLRTQIQPIPNAVVLSTATNIFAKWWARLCAKIRAYNDTIHCERDFQMGKFIRFKCAFDIPIKKTRVFSFSDRAKRNKENRFHCTHVQQHIQIKKKLSEPNSSISSIFCSFDSETFCG